MPETYNEQWVVVVKGNEYHLDKNQARILSDEIASGLRGIVMFKDFAISVPYIEEFYLKKRWKENTFLEEEHQEFIPIEEYKKQLAGKLKEVTSDTER